MFFLIPDFGEVPNLFRDFRDTGKVGGFDIASMPVNFHHIPVEDAEASMRLFSTAVIPKFRVPAAAA